MHGACLHGSCHIPLDEGLHNIQLPHCMWLVRGHAEELRQELKQLFPCCASIAWSWRTHRLRARCCSGGVRGVPLPGVDSVERPRPCDGEVVGDMDGGRPRRRQDEILLRSHDTASDVPQGPNLRVPNTFQQFELLTEFTERCLCSRGTVLDPFGAKLVYQ